MKNQRAIKAFGSHLRRLRESNDFSQEELANRANIAKITVQRIENAKVRVTIDVLIPLAIALKISLPELVDFEIPDEKEFL